MEVRVACAIRRWNVPSRIFFLNVPRNVLQIIAHAEIALGPLFVNGELVREKKREKLIEIHIL